ncbi:hypothetical protein AMELA_G00293900, partial [Ameiurus melas]
MYTFSVYLENTDTKIKCLCPYTILILRRQWLYFCHVNRPTRDVVSSLILTPTAISLEPTSTSCLLIALIVPAWPAMRDGPMCMTDNQGGVLNYYPNSFSAPDCQPSFMESKFRVCPDVRHYNSSDDDNLTQVWMGHMDKRLCGGLGGVWDHIASSNP